MNQVFGLADSRRLDALTEKIHDFVFMRRTYFQLSDLVLSTVLTAMEGASEYLPD